MKVTVGDPGPTYVLKDGEAVKTWPRFARLWLNWRGFMFWARTKKGHPFYKAQVWWPHRFEDEANS